jgi:hypothetical protein
MEASEPIGHSRLGASVLGGPFRFFDIPRLWGLFFGADFEFEHEDRDPCRQGSPEVGSGKNIF